MTAIVSFLDRHEGFGVWAGALASVFVGIVAVSVPYLQAWIDRRATLERLQFRRILAFTAALSALKVLAEMQDAAFEQQRTGLHPPKRREWDFDFRAAEAELKAAANRPLRDPAITQYIVRVRLRCADARKFDPYLHPDVTLEWLQGNAAERGEIARRLQHMLDDAVRSIRKPRPQH